MLFSLIILHFPLISHSNENAPGFQGNPLLCTRGTCRLWPFTWVCPTNTVAPILSAAVTASRPYQLHAANSGNISYFACLPQVNIFKQGYVSELLAAFIASTSGVKCKQKATPQKQNAF